MRRRTTLHWSSLTGVLLALEVTAGTALESTPGKDFSISNPMHYIRRVGGAEDGAPLAMHSKLIPRREGP